MAKYIVPAKKEIELQAEIEADFLRDAYAVIDDMIVDDFDVTNVVFSIEEVVEA